jgi:dTDP-4-amino-4,6-dideoxygalactose transaminase
MKIPFFGIQRQYATLRDELLNASDEVYKSGQVLDGMRTLMFEEAMAMRCDRKYAISVNSGTQALVFTQQLITENHSKVLIPTYSFIATLNSVLLAGNQPVFCDVDDSGLMDLESLDYAVSAAGVTALMYVNLFGNVIDYDKLKLFADFFNDGLLIIEDAAQSFGASYKGIPSGKLGDVSILSFDPTKNLPNMGSGGMILTDDRNFANECVNIKNNGKASGFEYPGTNSKMSESDCAQMLVKLKYFDQWQQRRTKIAEYYNSEFAELDEKANWVVITPKTTENVVHAWHKYVISTTDRYGLMLYLKSHGIETKVHYETTLNEQPVGLNYVDYAREIYRNGRSLSLDCLSLPIYPELTDTEVERIVESVKAWTHD